MNTKLIGLTGGKGSGKDTLCDQMFSEAITAGKTLERIALATPLKELCYSLVGGNAPRSCFDDQGLKEELIEDPVPGKLFTAPGTQLFQQINRCFAKFNEDYGRTLDVKQATILFMDRFVGQVLGMQFITDVSPRTVMQFVGTEIIRSMDPNCWIEILESMIDTTSCQYLVATDIRFDDEAECIRRLGGMVYEVVRDEAAKGDTHASELGVSPKLVNSTIYNNGTLQELFSNAKPLLDLK